MYLAKIKKKSQLTVPAAVMHEAGLKLGDYLEFVVEGGAIKLYPKKMVDARNNDTVRANATEGVEA